MRRLLAAFVMIAMALSCASAVAHNEASRGLPWQKDHMSYEFKHPMTVTCADYLTTDDVYQSYVAAWLTGNSHSKNNIEVSEVGYVVSVPAIVEQCTAQPDKSVWEVVDTMVKGHN